MYSAYQSGQFASCWPPVRFSCSPGNDDDLELHVDLRRLRGFGYICHGSLLHGWEGAAHGRCATNRVRLLRRGTEYALFGRHRFTVRANAGYFSASSGDGHGRLPTTRRANHWVNFACLTRERGGSRSSRTLRWMLMSRRRTWLKRTAKSCGPGAPMLASSS